MQFLHELAEKAVHMKNIRFNMKRAYKIRTVLEQKEHFSNLLHYSMLVIKL